MEVWVLKQKEWVPHCRFKEYANGCQVLGCWNKDGDMLVRQRSTGNSFFVYNLKSGLLDRTDIVVPDKGRHPNIFMHPNKLSSIRGIGANSFSMKKRDLKYIFMHRNKRSSIRGIRTNSFSMKESCQRLLSCY
ncbi:F-box domain-containing protein [Artemisia annua]|uniref:F-box domain-containing protein n=1 Tax=Artemisia annua TaxID=35608 RepID=A0A2U1KM78_ARTAN|nr:F-box domain-containing protein [Artemisia annua]